MVNFLLFHIVIFFAENLPHHKQNRKGARMGALSIGSGQPRKGLTGPVDEVLCSQTPYHHARLFCCYSILCHFLRDEPAYWRQLYAHSTAGKRRIGLRQVR
jgi:hypothetical protein